jgi:hypothetical protein
MSSHLCPFALWTALPSSLVGRCSHDYYGHSVTSARLAPREVDPVFVSVVRIERDVGVPLISLIALTGQRSTPRRCVGFGITPSQSMAPVSGVFPADGPLRRLEIGI